MRRARNKATRLLLTLPAVLWIWPSFPMAAECNTSSGSTCTLTCESGTASLVCGMTSTKCSAKCTGSSSSTVEQAIVGSIQHVLDVDNSEADNLFRNTLQNVERSDDGRTEYLFFNNFLVVIHRPSNW